ATSAITSNSGTLAFTNNSSATNFEYLAVPCGSPAPTNGATGTVGTATTSNPIVITGLTPNTCYTLYVRAVCDGSDYSDWSVGVNITTQVAPPVCGGNFVDSGGITGNYANNADSVVTICPVNVGDVVTVTFTAFNTQASNDGLYIFNGNSITSPLISSGNPAGAVPGGLAGSFWGTVSPGTITSSSPDGCLTFRFRSNGTTTATGWASNVTCAPPVACPSPIALSSSNVLHNSVNLSWNEMGTATSWQILALPCGSPAPTAASTGFITASSNPFVLTGLTPLTCYDIYIRSNCSTSTSTWTGPRTITTLIAPPACGGVFLDPGGTGNYANSITAATGTTVICPVNATDLVTVTFTSFSTESCCDFLSIYNGSSSSAPLIGTFGGTNSPGEITSTVPGGCLTFVFTTDSSVVSSGWVANVTCAPPPTCPRPTALVASATTSNSTTVSFTNNSTATSFEYIALPCGSPAPTNGTTGTSGIAFGTNPIVITGLTPATCYTIYVRAICAGNDNSNWSVGINVTTLVAPPVCGGTFLDPGGIGNYANNITAATGTTVICPTNATDLVTVTFTSFSTEGCCDFLSIYDGNSTSAPLIGTFGGTNSPGEITSSAPGGCLTFVFTTDGSVVSSGWVANIVCAPAPTCPRPTALSFSTTTSNSTTLSFTNNSTATNFEYIALPCGSPAPTNGATGTSGIAATTNPILITGLTPNTCYTVYIRAVCAGNDFSNWSVGANVTTQLAPPVCGGNYFDPGLLSNYSNNSNIATLICPTNTGDKVTITFTSFSTEEGFDVLSVYNGNSASAPLIGSFSGTTIPDSITSSAANGCLYFVFISNGTNVSSGWSSNITCAPPVSCPKPLGFTSTPVITDSTQLNWIEAGSATSWQILVQPCGTPNPTASSTGWITVSSSPYTITGLTPNCCNEYFIRSVCGGSATSDWTRVYNNEDGAYIVWADGPGNTLIGTYPGGTVTATFTGTGNTPTINPIGNPVNLDTSGTTTFETFGPTSNPPSQDLTFTFSTPVIISRYTMADIDLGDFGWNDTFNFVGVTFTSTTSANLLTTTTGAVATSDVSGNGEYGNWFMSTTPVTSFSLDYLVTNNLTHAYLSYAMKVFIPCPPITPPSLTVSVNSPIQCQGTTATVTATPNTAGTYNYVWTVPAGVTNPGNVASFTTTTGGNYSVVITSTTTSATASGSGIVTFNPIVTPTFTAISPICQNNVAPTLPLTSNNGISGTWNPATINTAIVGTTTYTFTPNTTIVGQECAIPTTLNITIVNPTVPTFTQVLPICSGTTLSALPTTSNNGVIGTWSPALNNSATTTYTFTPNSGLCATTTTMQIQVNVCDLNIYASAVWMQDCTTTGDGKFFNTTGAGTDLINPDGNNFAINYGVHVQNSATLLLRGAEIKTQKSGSSNICDARMNYRVFPTSSTPGAFTPWNLPFYSDCNTTSGVFNVGGGTCVTGQQKWQCVSQAGCTPPLDLTTFAPGNYTIQVYYDINGSLTTTTGCTDNLVLNNGGNYYVANFTIQAPATVSSTNPTTCSGAEGTITISNLAANATYSITYSDDTVVTSPTSYTSDASGNIVISGLNSGVYTNFSMTINNCTTNLSNLVILTDPALPSVSVNNSSICSTGTATVTATPITSGTYNYSWTVPATATNPGNVNSFTTQVGGLYSVIITNTTTNCSSSSANGIVTILPDVTMVLGSANNVQTVCINTPISSIIYTTTNGVTDVTSSGLPSGVTGTFNSGIYTITGIPTVSGTYNYSVTTSGGCGSVTLNGTITVSPNVTMNLTSGSSTQSVCVNTAIATIEYTTANGATNVTSSGLPLGVTGTFNSGVYTITGTPTISGTYNYTVTTSGGCSSVTLNGTITVSPNATLNLTSGNNIQNICINTAIATIEYTAGSGVTNVTSSGLPSGVTGTFNSGIYTITGIPTVAGTYNYSVTASSGCSSVTFNGTITVSPNVTMNLTSGSSIQSVCINTPITTIGYTTGNGATNVTSSGLPIGVTGVYNAGVYTISGTPTVAGTYNYTVTTSGGCSSVTLSGTITVNSLTLPIFTFGTATTICQNGPVEILVGTSSNGFIGTWSPSLISNTTSGIYTFTPNAGQCASTTTYTVTVQSAFDFEFESGCIGDNFTLQANPIENGYDENTATYSWVYNSNVVGTDESFDVTSYLLSTSVNETLPITFYLTITRADGCSTTKPIDITNVYCGIQKGISPNNDTLNDSFDLTLLNVDKLEIYNRYGMKVYAKSNYVDEWKGQSDKGDDLPDGTYYYVIQFKNNQPTKTGWIYINREY
uniref:CUB domain-containing protein n=1 Tax=Flavobacterium sp. TaxID=239 RepID=UPI002629791E